MKKAAKTVAPSPKGVEELEVSVNDVRAKGYKPTKTSGVKVRGTGAAQRGTLARGPMA